MLIIGDLAIKQYIPETDVNSVEVICRTEQKTYVRNYFNVSKTSKRVIINTFTTKWTLNSGRDLYIYTFENMPTLRKLVDSTFTNNYNFKFASIDLCYKFNIIRSSLIYNNVHLWQKIMSNTNKLYNKFIRNYGSNFLKIIETEAIEYLNLLSFDSRIKTSNQMLRVFDEYEEEDLHSIFETNKGKNYYDICYGKKNESIYLDQWLSLSHIEKLNIIRERIYVITINDYIIPYYRKEKALPVNTNELLTKGFMLLLNNVNEKFLFRFLIFNYPEIYKGLNRYYIKIFENAVKNNDLNKIK